MGRWSARLAPAFLEVAAIGNVRKVLDVGCGTGSLTLALAEAAPRATIVGIDLSQAFVDHARTKSSDARLTFEQGDAAALGSAVSFLLEQPTIAAGLVEEARKTGQRYDIAAFVRKMERLYELLHETSRATGRAGILKADLSFLTTER